MKPKTIKTLYWIVTGLFLSAMLMDAIGGITHQQAGIDNITHLGYPVYILTMMGTAKVLGVLAILQTRYTAIKEWAYAGFTISFLGAFWSRLAMGDAIGLAIAPVIMLAVMFVSYFLWKKFENLKRA